MSSTAKFSDTTIVSSGATTSVSPGADNPCWGGPEPNCHDLQYLLRVLSCGDTSSDTTPQPINIAFYSAEDHSCFIQRIHKRSIIYQDEHYLAIHKPADLRMDGQYRATVHKLLLYLFPPPSLQKLVADEMNNTGEEENSSQADAIQKRHQILLKSIAPLHKRNFLKDDSFRMIHQLDYATSGVLLLGKSRKATAVASQAFEERRTNKTYLAVVVNPPSSTSNNLPLGKEFFERLPVIPSSSLDSWRDGSLEKKYRKKRQRDMMDERESKRGTFNGFMPVQSVFDKWRAVLIRERKRESMQKSGHVTEGNGRRRRARDDLPPLPAPITELTSEEVEELLSLGPSYKKVKAHCAKHNKNWTTVVEAMAKEYNQSLAEFYNDGDQKQQETSLPSLFSIQNEDKNGNVDPNTFYICASIGEPKDGRFHVVVDPFVSNQPPSASPLPELRPSLTKCTVLWRGYVDTANDRCIPVTKVLLKPWTGRRHQLRVHLAHVAGCPIFGDVAYGGNFDADEETNERGSTCSRMCLHAKELCIPLFGDETKTFVAPDPFLTTESLLTVDN